MIIPIAYWLTFLYNVAVGLVWRVNPAANLVITVVLICWMSFNIFRLWTQRMPRILFFTLSIALGIMMGFLALSLILLVIQWATPSPVPILLVATNFSVLFQRVIFNPIVIQIQCELLKLFSVLSVRVTKKRINIFRYVYLAIYAISAIFIITDVEGLGIFQTRIGGLLDVAFSIFGFLFDIFVAFWVLQHLIRIKRANVKTGDVSSSIVIIVLIPCLGFYQLFMLFNLSAEYYLSLNALQLLTILVQVPVSLSLHYSLLIELFVHCRSLALSPSKNQVSSFKEDEKGSGLPRLLDVAQQSSSKKSEKSTFKEKETVKMSKHFIDLGEDR